MLDTYYLRYDPFVKEIMKEIQMIEQGVPGLDRHGYGPYLLALDVEKLAVITLNTAVNSILKYGNSGVQMTSLFIIE